MVTILPDPGMLQERLFVWGTAIHELINVMFFLQLCYTVVRYIAGRRPANLSISNVAYSVQYEQAQHMCVQISLSTTQ